MWLRSAMLTLMSAALLCLAIEAEAGKDKDVKKDPVKDAKVVKDAKKDPVKDKKFEVPKTAIAGVVQSVDLGKASFTISVNKKDRTFQVDKMTEFFGPKGGDRGTGPDGLKDDTMAKGYEIRVEPSADGKTAKNVYLPNRKTDTKEKDKKDKK